MCLYEDGRWNEAKATIAEVLEIEKRDLGVDYPSTLTSMANLASIYRNQGRWDAAEALELQVMEISKTKLGADHPDTLASIANLASTYRNQGRRDAAEELFVQVLETRKRVLGQEHPSTLAIIANLASIYRNQGRWKEAEELEVQVTTISSECPLATPLPIVDSNTVLPSLSPCSHMRIGMWEIRVVMLINPVSRTASACSRIDIQYAGHIELCNCQSIER